MITVPAKRLNKKVKLQKPIQESDGFGGFFEDWVNVKEFYAYLHHQKSSYLDSAGQRIVTKEKRIVFRFLDIKIGDRVVIGSEIYRIVNFETNRKQTQLDAEIEFVGFDEYSEVLDNFQTRVINAGGKFEAANCLDDFLRK